MCSIKATLVVRKQLTIYCQSPCSDEQDQTMGVFSTHPPPAAVELELNNTKVVFYGVFIYIRRK